jgi:N6-L-threonylcarbamoyladenine synthase
MEGQKNLPLSGDGLVILGIESSCDETAAAVWRAGKIRSSVIASQQVHERYGGVVPELASRAHMQHMVPVVDDALRNAGCSIVDIDGIAFTQSPGLIGSLLVGSQFAKSLALAMGIPLISVHHLEAHVLANLIDEPRPNFPFLCLTVSGGHTQIVRCDAPLNIHVLGQTLDDAAGEAFDKSAKLMGLPYPGGPLIDKFARDGNPDRFTFPEPKIPGLDFSFSGLKTSILYFLQQNTQQNPAFIAENKADICASVQKRIVSILINKLKIASLQTGIKDICIAGGVSANRGLRKSFEETGARLHWKTFIPRFEYCTDNAAMIAITGYYKYLAGDFAALSISPSAKTEV